MGKSLATVGSVNTPTFVAFILLKSMPISRCAVYPSVVSHVHLSCEEECGRWREKCGAPDGTTKQARGNGTNGRGERARAQLTVTPLPKRKLAADTSKA